MAPLRSPFQRQNSLTDLHEAVLKNCIESVEEAIKSCVPLDLVDHRGQTALYYACERGLLSLVRLLLVHSARHDLFDHNFTTPIWIAARRGHAEIVLLLLESGACANQKANDQTTALYHACYEGHVKCVYHLVKYGADVNLPKNSGASPLFVAARNGHHRIVKHLLKHGANPLQSQADLRSPLHTASLYSRRRCLRLIMRDKFDQLIEQKDVYGWTILHFLAKKGSCKTGRLFFHYWTLSRLPFDLEQVDWFGNTPLHIAAFYGRKKFLSLLTRQGLKIDRTNDFGWTIDAILHQSDQKRALHHSEYSAQEYLRHLLSTYQMAYTDEEEEMRQEVEEFVNILCTEITRLNSLFANRIICSGSYYEKTRVGLPNEFDYMVNLTELENRCQFTENDQDPPGYGRLTPRSEDELLNEYLEPITCCLSSFKVRQQFYQLLTSARSHLFSSEILVRFKHLKFEWTSGDKRCGTAIHAEWYGKQYGCLTIKIDVVPCLTINAWPKQAKVPCPLAREEFQLIARSPTADQTYLWRISTSRAEVKYLEHLDPFKTDVYRCLKSLRESHRQHHQIDRTKYTEEDLITSYMLKTMFLHELTRSHRIHQWIKGGFLHRIMSILKQLEKWYHRGFIASYFIANYSVIDPEDYKKLRKFVIQYIHSLREELKEKIRSVDQNYPRRHTISSTQPSQSVDVDSFRGRSYTTPL